MNFLNDIAAVFFIFAVFAAVFWGLYQMFVRPYLPPSVPYYLSQFFRTASKSLARGRNEVTGQADDLMLTSGHTSDEGSNLLTKAYNFFFSFDGRIIRSTFFFLQLIGGFLLIFSLTTFFISATETVLGVFELFAWVALPLGLWIGFSSCARRFRDLGITAWSTVLIFIPALNIAVFAMLLFAPTGTVKRILETPTV